MSHICADENSISVYAAGDTGLFSFIEGMGSGGLLLRALEQEPNHMQRGFGCGQVIVSYWNVGLVCYGAPTGDHLWARTDIKRVAQIDFSEAAKKYFVKSEDDFSTVAFGLSSGSGSERLNFEVLGIFNLGRYLLSRTAGGMWSVNSALDGSEIMAGQGQLTRPVPVLAGNERFVVFRQHSGSIEVYELCSGQRVFTVEPSRWFNAASLIQTLDPWKFRALVSSWDGKPQGAVLEIDVRRQKWSLVGASSQWNWDAVLLSRGDAVLRFFGTPPDRFVVTKL